jgi:hypothetical protein
VTLVPRAMPQRAAVDRYERAFASYKALYPALKGTMHDLHEQRADAASNA